MIARNRLPDESAGASDNVKMGAAMMFVAARYSWNAWVDEMSQIIPKGTRQQSRDAMQSGVE